MAKVKKTKADAQVFDIVNGNFDEHDGFDIEVSLQQKLRNLDTGKVNGVRVNNQDVEKDANGKVNIFVPNVSTDVTNPLNSDAAQAGAVAEEINALKSGLPVSAQVTGASQDGEGVVLEFYNAEGDSVINVNIPAGGDGSGEVITPKVTTELLSPGLIKLGDSVMMRWTYDCIRKADGQSESISIPALNVVITAKIGQTVVYNATRAQVAAGTTETLTIGPDIITMPGTVSISVVATTIVDEEEKVSRGSKSVTVITMNLATTFDPASLLSLSNGYTNTDGDIEIPYTYTVPKETTLHVWVDGNKHSTSSISGTGRNYIRLSASSQSAGRHNVQLIAENDGLLSDAVSVDFLKAGSTASYLGFRLSVPVSQLSDMPLAYLPGSSALSLGVEQFGELRLDLAAWTNNTLTSLVYIAVDGVPTQTLAADRNLQSVTQRFDEEGTHTLTIINGTAERTFLVEVAAASEVSETETIGYRTKLTATGRSNGESNPANWGGITTFEGVDWRTNGWSRGNDGVDALLLTNGAKANIDVKPFIQDGDYSIQRRGMTLEMEIMVSQVMERGATIISCLYDNDGNGYPMGIQVTTEEAGLLLGGVEEIKTADKMTDSSGNYINFAAASVSVGTNISSMELYVKRGLYTYQPTTDTVAQPGTSYYEAVVVSDEDDAADLYILRPHSVSMAIAIDKWVHLAFIVQPVNEGTGLAMLFINGVLSRANTYIESLRQNEPAGITINSDKADVRVRGLRYYRTPLSADEALGNWIIDRPTAQQIQICHQRNAVGDANNTADSDGNIKIDHDALLNKGRGILTIIRLGDTIEDGAAAGTGMGLSQLFRCKDKKENFKADFVRWEPPLDAQGNPIGEGFEARNVRMRIQGTSSVKYPYKNLRIYLTTQQGDAARSLSIGGVDVTDTAGGYALRGDRDSIEQSVICAKTDFVDSSLTMNTGGAHLFNNIMHQLELDTPPQEYDARVRQAIDGIPCDIYASTSENGQLTYCGQFVLNNEKSKSGAIFGMEKVSEFSGDSEKNPISIALEALTNSSPMTLFQPAGTENSTALANQLAAEFDDGFEFNFPEDAVWENVDEGQWDASKNKWSVKPVPGARAAIKRLMGWIYECVPSAMRSNPDYGTPQGWSNTSKAKWVSQKFKDEAGSYFDVNHLLTYYLFTDYWASVDQRAKNILWRTWDGLKWYATYYDGDTAVGVRNDAFLVYLYNITRDTYDAERAKYAYEGHNSWLWCLVLANFEDELKACAARLRSALTTEVMLNEFNNVMQGNWSERQYNKSGKLKYIDTIKDLNYVYTLTGNRELHRTQFIIDRARLLDARYGAGNYNGDVVTFTVVRESSDAESSLTLRSGDLYYFGYKLNGLWIQGPSRADSGESLTLTFTQKFATNDPLMLGGASCIKELDFSNMGSQLNGNVGLSLCTMLSKLIMPATHGASNAPLTFGNTSKLEYVDITGQTSVHTGTTGVFDISKHTRLKTFLAGGTTLTRIVLPEGAPIETLVLPSTIQTLTLRYLPLLQHEGLTLQGSLNIIALNFAACPFLSWQTLMEQCPNITKVRIEGLTGRVRSDELRRFMNGNYIGLDADGLELAYPALIGKVQLIDSVEDFEEMRAFFASCGLELMAPSFSEYVFHDNEIDPCNITNEDNKTGYAYYDGSATHGAHTTAASGVAGHPLGYVHSGHIVKLHDKCFPVIGYINPNTGKMNIQALDKNDYSKNANGTQSDITGSSNIYQRDVFLYVPKYYYKGVNNFKEGKKHFFLSSQTTMPESTATVTTKKTLSELLNYTGAPIAARNLLGELFSESNLGSVPGTNVTTYRVDVEGYRQVRYPGFLDNDQYTCCVFTDNLGIIVGVFTLTMNGTSSNPADFDNSIGDYDFREIPIGAKYLYFACTNAAAATSPMVVLTDSMEVEAIEPDWVTHQTELVGIYQGWVNGMTGSSGGIATNGLRSVAGKVPVRGTGQGTNTSWQYDENGNAIGSLPATKLNGSAQDFFNLASIRNELLQIAKKEDGSYSGEYSTVGYETSKDLANLFMVWFGTRDVESFVGRGGSPDYQTGSISMSFGDSSYLASNQRNKMWGIECWTASIYEWMDKCCFNTPSYYAFKKNKRLAPTGSVIDNFYNILQQDGEERRVKVATTNESTNVARVRFGRYCDIVASSFAGDTSYLTCYAAYQSANQNTGRVLGRSNSNANANAGVAYASASVASSYSYTSNGGRLCFFGEIENESELE